MVSMRSGYNVRTPKMFDHRRNQHDKRKRFRSVRYPAEINMKQQKQRENTGQHIHNHSLDSNVTFLGDFWQLDAPSGTSLSAILTEFIKVGRKATPSPTTGHGQSLPLRRGQDEEAIQGATERTECVRCQDT